MTTVFQMFFKHIQEQINCNEPALPLFFNDIHRNNLHITDLCVYLKILYQCDRLLTNKLAFSQKPTPNWYILKVRYQCDRYKKCHFYQIQVLISDILWKITCINYLKNSLLNSISSIQIFRQTSILKFRFSCRLHF